VVVAALTGAQPARAAQRNFDAGSLIIPMDLAYQDHGMLQAYGLLFQLLRQGIRVYWVIDQGKTWHAADCDTVADECAWDCAVEGSGVKCPYPTASPDFFAATEVVWDGEGVASPGDPISNHGYRGGPFVIDAADHDAALAIIDAWNDSSLWTANPWAQRTVFHVVTVHEATAAFSGWVRKEMIAAPTIAVFSDGNEDIATGYLRAAGIPQSNGSEFPAAKCGTSNCGPGTANPDMLTVPSVAGDMGTCDAPNHDHENGALFTDDGLPAYCQIMSMHWNVTDRETVQCNGGSCPATEAQCTGQTITYHGHEVVAEVRAFLDYPVHFFAECQAVNAYENTVPNPAWPFLDDDGRLGHFLTTQGTPPLCSGSCTDGDFTCVPDGCGAGVDCCLPKDDRELGAGFLIAAQPSSATLQILHPEVPYNQIDGMFATTGGSEPAYNLSTYLDTQYINNLDVTFITGPAGPGDQDVWMSGFKDGECDLTGGDDVNPDPGQCNGGKVSYLGGHKYPTTVPIDGTKGDSQGTRMFLNALFEADCVTSVGQPSFSLGLTGDLTIATRTLPVDGDYLASYANLGRGAGLDTVLTQIDPGTAELIDFAAGGSTVTDGVEWSIGSVSPNPPASGDPPASGTRATTLRFPDYGDYTIELRLTYRVGQTTLSAAPRTFTVSVVEGDPDAGPGGDGGAGGGDGKAGGCCRAGTGASGNLLLSLLVLALVATRRRSSRH